jgi:hypothetical protein
MYVYILYTRIYVYLHVFTATGSRIMTHCSQSPIQIRSHVTNHASVGVRKGFYFYFGFLLLIFLLFSKEIRALTQSSYTHPLRQVI